MTYDFLKIEKIVIQSMVFDGVVFQKFVDRIIPDFFVEPTIKKLFEYMREKNIGDINILGAMFPYFFTNVMDSELATAADIQPYIDTLKDLWFRRKAIDSAKLFIEGCKDVEKPTHELLSSLEQEIYTDENMFDMPEAKHIKEYASGVFDDMASKTLKNRKNGIKTGLIDVDEKLGDLHPGDLCYLAARPSMGKTSFAISVLLHNAKIDQVPTLLFSLETSGLGITYRAITQNAAVCLHDINKGILSIRDSDKISATVSEVTEAPIYIDSTPAININLLEKRAYKYVKKYGIKLIIIDHVGLIQISGEKNREQEISKISKRLKKIALKSGCVVIPLVQLSRGVEKRTPPEPMLSDMRDSGTLEEDADRVIMLYRPFYYFKSKTPKDEMNICFVKILKNRDGVTGDARTIFDDRTMRFLNVSTVQEGSFWDEKEKADY